MEAREGSFYLLRFEALLPLCVDPVAVSAEPQYKAPVTSSATTFALSHSLASPHRYLQRPHLWSPSSLPDTPISYRRLIVIARFRASKVEFRTEFWSRLELALLLQMFSKLHKLLYCHAPLFHSPFFETALHLP